MDYTTAVKLPANRLFRRQAVLFFFAPAVSLDEANHEQDEVQSEDDLTCPETPTGLAAIRQRLLAR